MYIIVPYKYYLLPVDYKTNKHKIVVEYKGCYELFERDKNKKIFLFYKIVVLLLNIKGAMNFLNVTKTKKYSYFIKYVTSINQREVL